MCRLHHPEDHYEEPEEEELLCECGNELETPDEIFSEECNKCFLKAVFLENCSDDKITFFEYYSKTKIIH